MNLSKLKDTELLQQTSHWAAKEREATATLLWHLKEVDTRKLYSDLKCSSLYDYCVKQLRYSEAQASRRVTACRLLRLQPDIAKLIESGELNLTQLNQVNQFFREENTHPTDRQEIIDKVKGKTTRETDRILADLKSSASSRRVTLTIKEETLQELKKVQDMKPQGCSDMDSLLVKMSAIAAREWDPTVVHRHREQTDGHTRYVPVQVKAFIWERDKGKCTNCGSTRGLQVDHIKPFALGGKTVPENLRLLCSNCNQRKGLKDFGPMGPKPNFAR